jgi:cytochrome c peroxidase
MNRISKAALAFAFTLASSPLTGCFDLDATRERDVELTQAELLPMNHDASGTMSRLLRRFKPITGPMTADGSPPSPLRVALGARLFEEKLLSRDGELACASCHDLENGGADGRRVSRGFGGAEGTRNAPTVFNAAGQFRQFWDGRADTIEAQAKGPILNPIEMAMPNAEAVDQALATEPSYLPAFEAAFPGEAHPINLTNVAIAIGAFERTLVTPSRWDRFLEGDVEALTSSEKEGFRVFARVGCMACHAGTWVGGAMFQRVGAVVPWPEGADQGRFDVTHVSGDEMMFKVPSLRNVTRTAPYFHDGSSDTLPDAVQRMAHHQLGVELTDDEVDAIVTWLGSLEAVDPVQMMSAPKALDPGAAPSAQMEPERHAKADASPEIAPPSPPPVELGNLAALMRSTGRIALQTKDAPALTRFFGFVGGRGPAGFDQWAGFAAEGATAARKGDFDAASRACDGCHVTYRERYRSTFAQGPARGAR